MIVVDASILLEVLLRSELGRKAEPWLFGSAQTLHAPELVDVEVAQTLRRLVAHGSLDADRAAEALTDLMALSIDRYSHGWLLFRIWELRNNLTAYDATYVALAEALAAPLLTSDRRLATAPGHVAAVELVS